MKLVSESNSQLPHSKPIVFLFTDTNSANEATTDVFLKITSQRACLLFEMLPSFKANKLVDELTKATEGTGSYKLIMLES